MKFFYFHCNFQPR